MLWGVGDFERATGWTAVDSASYFLDVAQQSFADHVDRSQEQIFLAALLSAHEEDFVFVVLASVANQLIFFQSQRQRLLAEHMLTGLQRFDGDLHVPSDRGSRC